ncbi:MAG: hypothetical protein AABY22_21030, partial [Nanoarchaeota archaeon]
PHNKGAACELGKGTDWCTAAPGLEYYKQYHKEDDPLFIIHAKTGEKFQFHYGSGQFMDSTDTQITDKQFFKEIHKILLNTVGEKYSFFKNFFETDIGYSKINIEKNGDDTYDIEWGDILTGELYGGDAPTIRQDSDNIRLRWNDVENTDTTMTSYKKGPSLITFEKNDEEELILKRISWWITDQSSNTFKVASIHPSSQEENNQYQVVLQRVMSDLGTSEEIWDKYYKQHYEKHIQDRTVSFAKEMLQKYYFDIINKV